MSVNVEQCVQMPFGLSFGESGALTLENCISVAKNSTNREAIDQN